jgi:exosome complex component RRP42
VLQEHTSAVVGVKAELGTPGPTQPNAGRIEFFVDCSALASPEFEGREGEELGHHMAHLLSQAYCHHSAIDRDSLCIVPGQQCWILYVDVLVLEWSGSVLDVISIAVRAALHNTRIPRLIVTGEGEEVEVEVSDNPHDSIPVDISHAPIIITLTQIGHNFVVDVNMKEEMCTSSRVSLAINEEGQTLSMNKDARGGISYSKLHDVIAMAQEVSKEVFHKLNSILHPQDNEGLGSTSTQLFS